MLSTHHFNQLRQLKAQGKTASEIGRQLGIDRKTASKYIATNTRPRYPDRGGRTRRDPLVNFEDRVRSLLATNPANRATDIFELIREQGYEGSERTVRRRVAGIRGEKGQERFFEQVYEPGEQAQFDFKECVELPFEDGPRTVHLHFGTLPYSDTCRVRGYPYRVYECFMDGVHRFFEAVGGMTMNVRIDNLSPCVKKILKGHDREYTVAFERAKAYYGFGVLPCRPGKGSDKGDVERDIRTYAARIKNLVKNKGIVFKGWSDLNAFLSSYMEKRQGENSMERFANEVKTLAPLPPQDEDVLCRVDIARSNAYGTIRINKSAYSVPDELIGVACKMVVGPYEVSLRRAGGKREEIAVHPRQPDGTHSLRLEHILPSLVRKPQAMVRWAHRAILFPKPVYQAFYERLKKEDSSSAEREFLRVMNLVQHVSWQEITVALELHLEQTVVPDFDAIRELLLGRDGTELSRPLHQPPLSPTLSQYDSLIPTTGGTNDES
jgi:transposase